MLRERRDRAVALLNEIPGVHTYCPNATFYLFPDVTDLMKRKGFDAYEPFRRAALHETGVSFCTRLHFGRPLAGEDRHYVRFAYSGIETADIEEGLSRFRQWAEA